MRTLGAIVTTDSIERMAADLLQPDRGLIGYYLDEITRQDTPSGPIDRLERPRTVRVRERVRRFSEDQLPALILVCPGTVGTPTRDGEGRWSAAWSLGIVGVAQDTDESLGREKAAILATAASVLLMQCLTLLDDRVGTVMWAGEASDDTDIDDARARHLCTRGLTFTVHDCFTDLGRPPSLEITDPAVGADPLDAGSLPTVLTTTTLVDKETP